MSFQFILLEQPELGSCCLGGLELGITIIYGMECIGGLDRSNQRFLICGNVHQKPERIDSTCHDEPSRPLSHWQIYSGSYSFYSLRYCIIKLLCVGLSFNLISTPIARDDKVISVLIYPNSYGC